MAPMAKRQRFGGKRKWHVVEPAYSVALKGYPNKLPPKVKKPKKGEATVVDIETKPKGIDTCSQLPHQDDSDKVGLGRPKSVVDMTASECHELLRQIIGGGEADDEQCAAMVHATLAATEEDHEKLVEQLEQQASAEELSVSDHDKVIEEITTAMDTGIFDMRGRIGQRFYDMHRPGTEDHTAYQQLVGRRQKQAYRAEWAHAQYKNGRLSKTHERSYSFVNRSHGCYRPFGAIVQKEGGWKDKAAVRAATVLALKCIKLGGEWTSRNELTERLEFWHIRREQLDDFTEAWDMRRNEEEAMRRTAMANPVKAPKRGKDPAAESREVVKPKAAARKAAIPMAARKKPRKDEIHAEAKALTLKAQWIRAVHDATALVECISDPSMAEWRWASNEENLGRLKRALAAVNAAQTTFSEAFLSTELATMKEAGISERLTRDLKRFLGTKRLVSVLVNETRRLLSMHRMSKRRGRRRFAAALV